jgi:hypothetical protein
VPNYYYASTLNGQKINLKNASNVTAVSGRYLGKKQSKLLSNLQNIGMRKVLLDIKKRIPLSNYITAMEKEKNIFYFNLLYYYTQ